MFPQKSGIKKKNSLRNNGSVSLDASLTSIEWLQNMQIGSNVFSETILPRRNSIVEPIAVANAPIEHKIEQKASPQAGEFQNHSKPPFSYVTLIRQAILSSSSRRMTLNEIYQWIIDAYPYFRTAPAKWKVFQRFAFVSFSGKEFKFLPSNFFQIFKEFSKAENFPSSRMFRTRKKQTKSSSLKLDRRFIYILLSFSTVEIILISSDLCD